MNEAMSKALTSALDRAQKEIADVRLDIYKLGRNPSPEPDIREIREMLKAAGWTGQDLLSGVLWACKAASSNSTRIVTHGELAVCIYGSAENMGLLSKILQAKDREKREMEEKLDSKIDQLAHLTQENVRLQGMLTRAMVALTGQADPF